MKILLFIAVLIFSAQANLWTVHCPKGQCYLKEGADDTGVASASYVESVNATGWSRLTVKTNGSVADNLQAYGAGYVEGALTVTTTWQSWRNFLLVQFSEYSVPAPLMAWIEKNLEWMQAEISTNPTDPYWQQVNLVLSQLKGLSDGYNNYCTEEQKLSFSEFVLMNAEGDLEDLAPLLNHTDKSFGNPRKYYNTHCSAFIRQSQDKTELFAGHTTWADYSYMLRTWKVYNLSYSNPSNHGSLVSFAGYPGILMSGDDYYITNQHLMITETTNGFFNASLNEYIVTSSVLSWIRTIVANRMAVDGSSWTSTFAKYNSGTYNNQWMILDYKKFTPGTTLPAGALWILEQMPGQCESADVTDVMNAQGGYWPSYNIPYFQNIFIASGFQEQVDQNGPDYSYSGAPRAKIFKRDFSSVNSLEQTKALLRYNGWQWDPLSEGDSMNAISSRGDLAPPSELGAFGGIDSKVTSYRLFSNFKSQAISGPTFYQQRIFAWDPNWSSHPHEGCAPSYEFDWQTV